MKYYKKINLKKCLLEQLISFLLEDECSGHGAAHRDRVLLQHEVVLPLLLVRELDPAADRVEVLQDHHQPLPESTFVSLKGQCLKNNVCSLLAQKSNLL